MRKSPAEKLDKALAQVFEVIAEHVKAERAKLDQAGDERHATAHQKELARCHWYYEKHLRPLRFWAVRLLEAAENTRE